MDNASKALIIAGAVLIAVMLVSLGVLIYNQANQIVQDNATQMQGLSVSGFNNLFSAYYGNNKPSATVRSLLEQVNATNRTSEDHQVEVVDSCAGDVGGDADGSYTWTPSKNANYKISGTDFDNNGYVTEITIEDAD